MEIWKDLGIVALRIATLFPLLLCVTLFMGRRSVGKLPVFDFLIILALGSVVGADIANPQIKHLPTAFAIVMIGLLQKLVAALSIRYRTFGRWTTFEPVVVIQDGKIMEENLRKQKYSVDTILQMLREKDIFNISAVTLAVLESNGRLSVLKNPSKTPVTPELLQLPPGEPDVAYPVILEGKFEQEAMAKLHVQQDWLANRLQEQGVFPEDVFLATLDGKRKLTITRYQENIELSPLRH
ncbi:DUF421 domain-containing protein [Paenibacillus sp. GCM10012307]|uniref:DUF421 domain-containing protein n=1 Tax=Paenibacillus roseus TaxID=2798579 RepID=A0A934MPK0_9BACL|nr:DUF421 domain-containing protein [Paenibacillus roseus]MBJ6360953.1 DUF421 domain-containing protein [Paenibacillus roseus]